MIHILVEPDTCHTLEGGLIITPLFIVVSMRSVYTMYTVHCTMYCTLYTVYCTLYNINTKSCRTM